MQIIFIDGECLLCNNLVKLVDQYDSKNIFLYSTLQSKYAQDNLPSSIVINIDTLVLKSENSFRYKSEAILEIIRQLDYPVKLLYVFNILPFWFLNMFYSIISNNRKKIFKKNICVYNKKILSKFV